MYFSFSHPSYLFLLLLIPVLIGIHFFSIHNKKKVALKFANFEAIGRIKGIDFFSKNIMLLILNSLILLTMVFSISGLTAQVVRESSDFSFVIAIDSSDSMRATDLEPDRISVAKNTAIDFIEQSPIGIKFGIVSFSGISYIEQELSDDKDILKQAINKVEIRNVGGTDIYEAIKVSSSLLKNENLKSIILLSDGQINTGDVEEIINYVKDNKIIVHTIAIGTKEGGETYFGISKLDEDFLKSISYNSGGEYFFVENQKSLSESLLSILNLTEKEVSINLSNYLIFISIGLFLVTFFIANTRYLNLF